MILTSLKDCLTLRPSKRGFHYQSLIPQPRRLGPWPNIASAIGQIAGVKQFALRVEQALATMAATFGTVRRQRFSCLIGLRPYLPSVPTETDEFLKWRIAAGLANRLGWQSGTENPSASANENGFLCISLIYQNDKQPHQTYWSGTRTEN